MNLQTIHDWFEKNEGSKERNKKGRKERKSRDFFIFALDLFCERVNKQAF